MKLAIIITILLWALAQRVPAGLVSRHVLRGH
jgi:hypothetical protein